MNIKDYEYVFQIAALGSISRAADKLFITQSALTRYLQRLEADLGTPLFYRNSGRLLPTKAGQLYLAKAARIIDLDHELVNEISQLANSRDGAIRLGYPMGLISFISEFLLPAFYREYPEAILSLTEASSQTLIQSVGNGHLDLCLAYVSEAKTGLQYDTIDVLPGIVLAASANSPLFKKSVKEEGLPFRVLSDREWLEEPYIQIAPHSRSGQAAESYFRKLGQRPRTRLYVDDTRSALMAVEQKIGVSLLTASLHTDRLVRFLILPDFPDEPLRLCLATRKGEAKNRTRDGLVRLIHETYPSIHDTDPAAE